MQTSFFKKVSIIVERNIWTQMIFDLHRMAHQAIWRFNCLCRKCNFSQLLFPVGSSVHIRENIIRIRILYRDINEINYSDLVKDDSDRFKRQWTHKH